MNNGRTETNPLNTGTVSSGVPMADTSKSDEPVLGAAPLGPETDGPSDPHDTGMTEADFQRLRERYESGDTPTWDDIHNIMNELRGLENLCKRLSCYCDMIQPRIHIFPGGLPDSICEPCQVRSIMRARRGV